MTDKIIEALRKADPVWDGECSLCGAMIADRMQRNVQEHAATCPWRMAHAVAEEPVTHFAFPSQPAQCGTPETQARMTTSELPLVTCRLCKVALERPQLLHFKLFSGPRPVAEVLLEMRTLGDGTIVIMRPQWMPADGIAGIAQPAIATHFLLETITAQAPSAPSIQIPAKTSSDPSA